MINNSFNLFKKNALNKKTKNFQNFLRSLYLQRTEFVHFLQSKGNSSEL